MIFIDDESKQTRSTPQEIVSSMKISELIKTKRAKDRTYIIKKSDLIK